MGSDGLARGVVERLLSDIIKKLSSTEQAVILGAMEEIERGVEARKWEWGRHARPEQLAPSGDWDFWVLLTGRGWGKTRTGSEYIRGEVEKAREPVRVALVGRSAADVRDIMVEGQSGLMAVFPPDRKPLYEPTKRRVTFVGGSQATTYSGDEPDQLRGPEHHLAWCDELASWRYADAWDQLQFGLRLGIHPRCVVTSTPRPTRLIKALVANPRAVVVRGHTMENRANLPPIFLQSIMGAYEGTRLGRQELKGEILEDVPGALFTQGRIDELRVQEVPPLRRIVVAVDPGISQTEEAAETGVVVCGVAGVGVEMHGYVLADRSLKGSPLEWARAVVGAWSGWGADRVVGEQNQGGDLVERNIRTVEPNIAYRSVHATRAKVIRAEPIGALYEQGRIHHVGNHPVLEDQMTGWSPLLGEKSPDRMDALVWGFTDLMLQGGGVWRSDLVGGVEPQTEEERKAEVRNQKERAVKAFWEGLKGEFGI